jgi:hypothetical protein
LYLATAKNGTHVFALVVEGKQVTDMRFYRGYMAFFAVAKYNLWGLLFFSNNYLVE